MANLTFSMEVTSPDWDKIEEELNQKINEGMQDFADKIEATWRDKAAQTLKTTKDQYLKRLSVEKIDNGVEVTLSGTLPVNIETGCAPFDMKPKLLGNAISKIIPLGAKKEQGIPATSFAIVRKSSPQSSWWHPGFQAIKIGEQIQEEVPEITKEVFGPLIDKMSP